MSREITVNLCDEAERYLNEGAGRMGVSVSELVTKIINAWAILQIMMKKDA